MQANLVSKIKCVILGCFIISVNIYNVTGQLNEGRPEIAARGRETNKGIAKQLPIMWIPKLDSRKFVAEFVTGSLSNPSKLARCRQVSVNEKSYLLYSIGSFQSLLKKMTDDNAAYENLRIYIASFDTAGANEGFTNLPDKTLILIFAPADDQQIPHDLGHYYFINETDSSVNTITSSTKKKWVDFYVKNKMPQLVKTIASYKRHRENYETQSTGNRLFSDTKSILYRRNDFHEAFFDEVAYQYDRTQKEIKFIQANFASYTSKGISEGKLSGVYKKRLFVLFDYYTLNHNKQKELLCIDDQPGFGERTKPSQSALLIARFDNGHLCPANCPL